MKQQPVFNLSVGKRAFVTVFILIETKRSYLCVVRISHICNKVRIDSMRFLSTIIQREISCLFSLIVHPLF